MKLNGTQGTYHSVPQNLQTEESSDEPKKVPSQESVIQNGPNVKTPSPTKEQPEDISSPEDEKKPMSPLRKFCFVLSLLQCVLFIVAFGWLIPCKIPRHADSSQCSHDWELNFYGEDIVTPLAISSTTHKPVALLFGFSTLTNASIFGIQAVNAFDGSKLWQQEMSTLPKDIVCGSIDVNTDNIPDCIVTDQSGQMMAISIVDGQVMWYMHSHHVEASFHSQGVSRPVLGNFCPGLSAPLIYTAVQDQSGNYFVVTVSSTTGQIQSIYNLTECAVMPENIMWRNIKIEHDEMHSPLELVMSCANKAGQGIVYTTNADDLCSNTTFKSYNTISFKLAITEPSEYPVHIKPLVTEDGDHLVLTTHDSKVKILIEDRKEKAQFLGEGVMNIDDFTIGQFTNNSIMNIAIVGTNDIKNASKILLLDNVNTNPVAVIPIENGTVISMFTVHKAFKSVDGILVKIVSKVSDEDVESGNVTDQISYTAVTHFEEKFAILECLESRCLKVISEDVAIANCQDCEIELHHDAKTATVVDVDNDGTEELIYFIGKALPSTLVKSVTLKLVRLSDHLNAGSCTSCHC